ncbi:hypothetical protein RchiOBHm_Chr4g0403691 [Rosa chinensis]|uniref:Uncharacterized protein n=1 Tax=Rosa chinensis TaxID=74649 RepID=A0A2P6QTS7_ROSCH|nr:hypothetical protein RchiOBHm_Chr4g0403691 [Rosa chinensis]
MLEDSDVREESSVCCWLVASPSFFLFYLQPSKLGFFFFFGQSEFCSCEALLFPLFLFKP